MRASSPSAARRAALVRGAEGARTASPTCAATCCASALEFIRTRATSIASIDAAWGACSDRRSRTGCRRSASLVLALLLLAYIFNYLDRQILGILAGPIIADLASHRHAVRRCSSGPPFAILYSVLGIPFAFLADRTSRSRVIAAALAFWSGFTALCGTAPSFWQLFVFRMGVGIGEAGGVAPVLCADRRLFRAASAARGRWRSSRSAFRSASRSAPCSAPTSPTRSAGARRSSPWASPACCLRRSCSSSSAIRAQVATRPSAAPIGQVFPMLARKPVFWLMAFAASSSSLCGYGLAIWTPSVLERSFGMGLIARGQFLASVVFIGGCTGVFAGGWLADRLGALRPRLVRQAPGDRLADHRADLRGRADGAEPVARLAAAADSQRAQHPLARAGDHRGPASRPAADARDRLGELPADQQSHRPRRRAAPHRRDSPTR